MDEEQDIYRGELLAIMGALADIHTETAQILAILIEEDEDDGEEEEETEP